MRIQDFWSPCGAQGLAGAMWCGEGGQGSKEAPANQGAPHVAPHNPLTVANA